MRRKRSSSKVELYTADMRELPFANGTFDLVVSSLAIHNISQREGRDKALEEIEEFTIPASVFAKAQDMP